MIPYGRQDIDQADIDAVVAVLRSDYLTQGPVVPRFEAAMAAYTGARHAVAVNSATSALHIACLALDLKPGQSLWTVPNTFVASANCARYCGADVDFVDIAADTWNISVPKLADKLVAARKADRLPSILVPVDFGGQSVPIEAIAELGREFGFRIVEDASHAVGATRHDQRVGNAQLADVVVFSFHPVKIITSGEGGMALTNSDELAWRLGLLRSHGITREAERMTAPPAGGWAYEQVALGYNYRLTDIQAALGLSQFERLDGFVAKRNMLAQRYQRILAGLPLRSQVVEQGNVSAYHLYMVRLDDAARRRQVYDALRAADIGTNVHYTPVHRQPYYQALGFKPGHCPEAESYGADAITLPLYPGMSEGDQDFVVATLRKALA